jgi:hypothetical protein
MEEAQQLTQDEQIRISFDDTPADQPDTEPEVVEENVIGRYVRAASRNGASFQMGQIHGLIITPGHREIYQRFLRTIREQGGQKSEI